MMNSHCSNPVTRMCRFCTTQGSSNATGQEVPQQVVIAPSTSYRTVGRALAAPPDLPPAKAAVVASPEAGEAAGSTFCATENCHLAGGVLSPNDHDDTYGSPHSG